MPRRPKLPPWIRIVRERPMNYGANGPEDRTHVRSPRDLVELLTQRMESEEVEIFVAVSLDAQHRVIGLTEVTHGLASTSLVHPREVFRTFDRDWGVGDPVRAQSPERRFDAERG